MIEPEFNADRLYSRIAHYYVDKKRYPKEKANRIAELVVRRELAKRVCANPGCGHKYWDHVRNHEVCLTPGCGCTLFVRA